MFSFAFVALFYRENRVYREKNPLQILTCAEYTMWTPWKTIFLAYSARNVRISVTVASNGSPLSRMQSLCVPLVISC